MSYSRSHDFPRVCGLALEAADRYRATVGAEFPVAVVLDVGKPGELTVTQDIDPDLPQVLQFANGAKACIDEELRALGIEMCGPLGLRGFRGPGPKQEKPQQPARGEQLVATIETSGKKKNVDLRVIITEGGLTYSALIEQKYSASIATAEANARAGMDELWPVARGGLFEDIGTTGKGKGKGKEKGKGKGKGGKVTARAACVGMLAISPTTWTLEVYPRTAEWAGYPATLRRSVQRRPLPADVAALFPHQGVVAQLAQRAAAVAQFFKPARAVAAAPPAPIKSPAPGPSAAAAPPAAMKPPPPAPQAPKAPAGLFISSPAPAAAAAAAAPLASPAPTAPKPAPKAQRPIAKKTTTKKTQPWTKDGKFDKALWRKHYNKKYNKKQEVKDKKAAANVKANATSDRKAQKSDWEWNNSKKRSVQRKKQRKKQRAAAS